MELRESIESINEKLLKEFGTEISAGNMPRFRVVFSEDIYEKRWTEYTDEGFQLIQPEVRLLPKYKQWVHEKYILERLIPVSDETDLTSKISYEPAWVFEDSKGNYLPPFFDACRFVIESLMSAIDKANTHVKYKDKNVAPEERMEQIKKMEEELFGNESDVTDALAYGSGVTVPENKLLVSPEKIH